MQSIKRCGKITILLVVFAATCALAFYGSLVLQRADLNIVAEMKQTKFEDFTTWVTLPGDVITTLIMNPTDIPERDPEPWAIRWYITPISAVFWTTLLILGLRIARYVRRRLSVRVEQRK